MYLALGQQCCTEELDAPIGMGFELGPSTASSAAKLADNKNLKTGFEPSDQQNSVFVDDLGVADGKGRVGLAEVHHLQVSKVLSKKDSCNLGVLFAEY